MLTVTVFSSTGDTKKSSAASVTVPGVAGELQILPGHSELFCLLAKGDIVITSNTGSERVNIESGELHVVDDTVDLIVQMGP